MQQDLVQERQIASRINCDPDFPGQRYNNLFLITGNPRLPHTNEELEEAIYEHLERLKSEPVKQEELQRIISILEYSTAVSLRDNLGMAHRLLTCEIFQGDWRKSLEWEQEISKISPEDIRLAARRYFNKENRTVAYLETRQRDRD